MRAVFTINTLTLHGCAQSCSDNIYNFSLKERLQVNRVLKKKSESLQGFGKEFKVGGFLYFTGGFGLKVRQVSAGFGCREGYYKTKSNLILGST